MALERASSVFCDVIDVLVEQAIQAWNEKKQRYRTEAFKARHPVEIFPPIGEIGDDSQLELSVVRDRERTDSKETNVDETERQTVLEKPVKQGDVAPSRKVSDFLRAASQRAKLLSHGCGEPPALRTDKSEAKTDPTFWSAQSVFDYDKVRSSIVQMDETHWEDLRKEGLHGAWKLLVRAGFGFHPSLLRRYSDDLYVFKLALWSRGHLGDRMACASVYVGASLDDVDTWNHVIGTTLLQVLDEIIRDATEGWSAVELIKS